MVTKQKLIKMKKYIVILIILFLSNSVYGQRKKSIEDIKYKRNSLSIFLVSDGDYPNRDKVSKAYENYEFPDKYNDHRINIPKVDLSKITFTEEEFAKILEDFGFETKEDYEESIKLAKEIYGDWYKDPRIDLYKLKKYIIDNKLGSKVIEKWYDSNSDGEFDNNLIEERGLFNASKEDIEKANSQTRGEDVIITGAALDLIPQTYLVFNKMSFFSNEKMAAKIRKEAQKKIDEMKEGFLKDLAIGAADDLYKTTSIGYTVSTNAYLFKLKWDEQDQTNLYSNWNNKEEFLKNDFPMEHVGTELANSIVTFSLKKEDVGRTEDDIINLATVRNVEKVFARLTKRYEDFKPKVPLAEFGPFTAFIGMKEGLMGGETFEVLNEEYDNKTGRTIYKTIGKIKVDKKSIWDNRYNLNGEPNDTSGPDRTLFKGKVKNATYGSLLRFKK